MKKTTFFLVMCIILTATGCPKKLYTTKPSTKFSKNKLLTQVNSYLKNRQMAYYCAITKQKVNFDVSKMQYSCGNTSANAEESEEIARRLRDEAIMFGVTAVDSVYNDFVGDLNTGRATTNFIADVIDLGVGAAVGITKGERPLQILGVALTAFRGGRKSIDLNFYREQTVPILVNKMDDNRIKVQSEIFQKKEKNKDRPVREYPMEEVIRDIVNYYNAGTLIRAFSELAKETAATAKTNEEKLLRLKGIKALDAIPSVEEVDAAQDIFKELRTLDSELNEKDNPKTQEAAKNRIELVYAFITKDGVFADTIKTLREKGDQDVVKPIFKKIDEKKELTAAETFEFVYGIFEFTEGNVPLTKKLRDILAKTKIE